MRTDYGWAGSSLYAETEEEKELLRKVFDCIPKENKNELNESEEGWALQETRNGELELWVTGE